MVAETLRKPDTSSVESYLNYCLSLNDRFAAAPGIKLVLATQPVSGNKEIGALDVVVTTAKQCYAPGTALLKQQRDERSVAIATSTLEAGHHTTRQHTHYTWRFDGVSRHVTHDVLHTSPFYNSEQQSQRFVEVEEGAYVRPAGLSERQATIFKESADYSNRVYGEFLALLAPEVEARMRAMYPRSGWSVDRTAARLNSKAKKICQEVARYVLPIAQKTNYYHTLSELQLLRMFRSSMMENFSDEARFIIGSMVATVAKHDSTILDELRKPLSENPRTRSSNRSVTINKNRFDAALGGLNSRMLPLPEDARGVLARATRNVLGDPDLSDSEALNLVFDPAVNPYLGDVYDVGMFDPLTSTLRQVSPVFLTKLSHTADSQRQRHRMTPGATPSIDASYDGSPDYVTPLIVRESDKLRVAYEDAMGRIYENVEQAFVSGMPREQALTLLPNAHALRIVESGDMFDFIHRWRLRLCYLAQEEIFFVSVEQAQQVLKEFPEGENVFKSPCGIRKAAGITPRCPEGDRFCGKPVFNMRLEEYVAGRLV